MPEVRNAQRQAQRQVSVRQAMVVDIQANGYVSCSSQARTSIQWQNKWPNKCPVSSVGPPTFISHARSAAKRAQLSRNYVDDNDNDIRMQPLEPKAVVVAKVRQSGKRQPPSAPVAGPKAPTSVASDGNKKDTGDDSSSSDGNQSNESSDSEGSSERSESESDSDLCIDPSLLPSWPASQGTVPARSAPAAPSMQISPPAFLLRR